MNTRIEKLQKLLGEHEALLVSAVHSVRYLTQFPSGDSYLFVTRESAWFLTDFRYIELAKQTVKDTECRMITGLLPAVKQLVEDCGVERLHIETTAVDVRLLTRLQQVTDVCVDGTADGWLMQMRTVKEPFEVEKILQAQALTEEGFTHILNYIREGKTERDVALELEFYIRKRGAECVAFDFIVVSGKHSSLPHGIPTDKPIRRGEFITMDFGAVVDGYHSDMTRTVALGRVDEQQHQVYDTVLAAQTAALEVLRAGVRCCDGDAAARQVIEAAGYGAYFGHATGHGVGMQIHEEPRLSVSCEAPLQTGNVVTVEPGIYLEGQFGVRIEDMVCIRQEGCQNLTKAPKELICL